LTESFNYTGQRHDETGLLYYNARYYDPALGRFVSADSVVPGAADGSMAGVAVKPLTVAFFEPELRTRLQQENQQPFWFQLSDAEQQQAPSPWGPQNPQALNRYSYVLNNPIRWTDPTGRWVASLTVGYSRSELGWAGVGSVGISFDGEGNVAFTLNGGGGGTTGGFGAALGLTGSISFDAPNIDAVAGWSTVVGGSGGGGLIAGGDIAFSKKADGEFYHMGSVTAAVGLEASGLGLPVEGHLLGVRTAYGPRMNVIKAYTDLERGYNNFVQETTRSFLEKSGVAIPR
jgi:RHS repeat-associated protein